MSKQRPGWDNSIKLDPQHRQCWTWLRGCQKIRSNFLHLIAAAAVRCRSRSSI